MNLLIYIMLITSVSVSFWINLGLSSLVWIFSIVGINVSEINIESLLSCTHLSGQAHMPKRWSAVGMTSDVLISLKKKSTIWIQKLIGIKFLK